MNLWIARWMNFWTEYSHENTAMLIILGMNDVPQSSIHFLQCCSCVSWPAIISQKNNDCKKRYSARCCGIMNALSIKSHETFASSEIKFDQLQTICWGELWIWNGKIIELFCCKLRIFFGKLLCYVSEIVWAKKLISGEKQVYAVFTIIREFLTNEFEIYRNFTRIFGSSRLWRKFLFLEWKLLLL